MTQKEHLNEEFADKLLDILKRIPALKDKDNRTNLLRNLPKSLSSSIPSSSAPLTHLMNIVDYAKDTTQITKKKKHPLEILANNALRFVEGTELEKELHTLCNDINKATQSTNEILKTFTNNKTSKLNTPLIIIIVVLLSVMILLKWYSIQPTQSSECNSSLYYEENDDIDQSCQIEPETFYIAKTDDENDFFSFELEEKSKVIIKIKDYNPPELGQLMLYSKDKSPLKKPELIEHIPELETNVQIPDESQEPFYLSEGTYYVRVYNKSCRDSEYVLWIETISIKNGSNFNESTY